MRRSRQGLCRTGLLAVLAVLAWAGPGAGVARGVSADLLPADTTVSPGSEFEIQLWVTDADSAFNGFHVDVAYDTTALTRVPLSPISLQIGTLMTDACANLFHRYYALPGKDSVSVIMLCNGVSVTGPGQLYRFRFRASATVQTTTVRIVDGSLMFYDAGLFVPPQSWADARIGIGMDPVGVGDGATAPGPSLAVAPNPARGRVVFTIGGAIAGPESLTVRDVQGRRVCRMAAAGRQVTWDGRHELGHPVPNGTYFATLESGGRSRTVRFSLLR
jgi:hypothetical protein